MTLRHKEKFEQVRFKNPTVKIIERILEDPNINENFKNAIVDQMKKHDWREQ